MRRFLFSIVLLLTMMTVPSWAQGRYNVFAENQPLSTVLKQISAQSEYNFVYNNDLIDTSVKVTVTISSDNISDILDAVAGKTGLRYTIVGKQIAAVIVAPPPVVLFLHGGRKPKPVQGKPGMSMVP